MMKLSMRTYTIPACYHFIYVDSDSNTANFQSGWKINYMVDNSKTKVDNISQYFVNKHQCRCVWAITSVSVYKVHFDNQSIYFILVFFKLYLQHIKQMENKHTQINPCLHFQVKRRHVSLPGQRL